MKITRISLTGADDHTDINDLFELSRAYPMVEWGILFSSSRAGNDRYPSADWIGDLVNRQTAGPGFNRPLNLAAHLCGKTMRGFMTGITFEGYDEGTWLHPHGLSLSQFNAAFQRAQINFNAQREGYTKETLQAVLKGWYESVDGVIITQHNDNNADVWAWCQSYEHQDTSAIKAHQVLHDASGGTAAYAPTWQKPIAGVLNGYAGGLGPDNVVDTLMANQEVIGDGCIWIDMEGALRTNERFDLDKAEAVLKAVTTAGKTNNWLF